MPINPKYKASYQYEGYYHVFNRTTAGQLMFRDNENYIFFLERFQKYLGRYVCLHAWCLIPNHFHFLIQIKEEKEIIRHHPVEDINYVITRSFKNFFLSYSLSYKNMYELKTNLFAPKYKHVRLYNDWDVLQVILYIHRNPSHHHVGDWKSYRWSSYNTLVKSKEFTPSKHLILRLFRTIEDFSYAHEYYVASTGVVEGSEPLKGSEPSTTDNKFTNPTHPPQPL